MEERERKRKDWVAEFSKERAGEEGRKKVWRGGKEEHPVKFWNISLDIFSQLLNLQFNFQHHFTPPSPILPFRTTTLPLLSLTHPRYVVMVSF
jgi:hypothetical protein